MIPSTPKAGTPAPTAPPRGFPVAEYAGRLERAQRLMSARDIGAVLLTTEADLRYFTGFATPMWRSPTRSWFLVLPRAGAPIAVVPEIGAPVMARTWVEDVRSWPAPVPDDDGVSLLAAALRRLVPGSGRLGILMGHQTKLRMPLADHARLLAALPGVEVADATDVVRSLRMVKSDAEIDKLAAVARIASDAFDAVPDLARQGRSLREVVRDFRVALLHGGADDVVYLAAAASPGGYVDVVSEPTDRPVAAGDVLMLDTGALRDGYMCDFDRNYGLVTADADARRAYDTLYRATEAGLTAARPGMRCRDVYAAMVAVVTGDGYATGNVGRFGHGLGLQLTEWPSHTATDTTVLVPGMVVTLEPGLTIAPGRGMVHEEDIVVRDGEPEMLTRRAPPELPVLPG